MQDKSIDGALLALRRQIIRAYAEGLAHVEALLALRGVHMPAVLPAKRKDAARKGHMTRLVLETLSGGPLRLQCIVSQVEANRPDLDHRAASKRTSLTLARLKRQGAVRHEGVMWGQAL